MSTMDLSEYFKYIESDATEDTYIVNFDQSKSITDVINYFIERKSDNDHFYMVNVNSILEQLNKWKRELPYVLPFYAVKSNPDRTLLKLLAENGCGFDCASKLEIIEALQVSDPDKIIYANPCKEITHLQYAKSNGVELMTFDSENELHKVKLNHPNAKLVIRIQVDDSGSLCKFNSKFGVPLKNVEKLIKMAEILELDLVGVSFHVGSGCSKSGMFISAIQSASTAFQIGLNFGFKFNILDIGGGFPGDDSQAAVPFSELANEIHKGIIDYFGYDVRNNEFIDIRNYVPDNFKVVAEPGRFMCTNSHTLACNVIGMKKEYDEDKNKIFKYTINDGVYGTFNCVIFDGMKPNIIPHNKKDEKKYKSIVFGPTCDSVDTITKDCMLPELSVGDWIYVSNFGAYTRASTTTFNGFMPGQVYYYQYKDYSV
jgi:ornithine decarboxylase